MRNVAPVATARDELLSAWSLDPLALTVAFAATVFFVTGWRRLRRRRPELAPWSRISLFLAGMALVVVGAVSPLDAIAEEYLQSAHMLQHVLIADLGVALLVVALRGPLMFFFLPRDLLGPLARARPLRGALVFLLRPSVALPLWFLVLVTWHVPALYETALEHPFVHRAEHLSFVVVGLLVWTLIVDPGRHGRLSTRRRLGVVALVFWGGQMLAYALTFGFDPYYDVYTAQPERLLGLSPLGDQRLAGVVMMVEQLLTLGVAFVLLLREARQPRPEPRPTPQAAR